MDTSTRADPPHVPLRRRGWPVRRTPWWIFAALLAMTAGIVLVSLSHRPSQAQRAADLTGFLGDVSTGIESCAGGLQESMTALNTVESGQKSEYRAAVAMLKYNAQNCSPADNEPLADFTQYQVSESLAGFNLQACVNDVITWAFPYAMQSQQDMLAVLTAGSPAARSRADAVLAAGLRKLNAERSAIYATMRAAERATSDHAPLPVLPG